MALWFVLFLVTARGAERYHFMFAPAVCFFAAQGVSTAPYWARRLARPRWQRRVAMASAVVVGVGIGIGSIQNARTRVLAIRSVLPASWHGALSWMRANHSEETVVAAWWDRGSELSYAGRVTNIVDEYHYIPYWIHLLARHVYSADSAEEALGFLRAHRTDYIVFSMRELNSLEVITHVGSDAIGDRQTPPVVTMPPITAPQLQDDGTWVVGLMSRVDAWRPPLVDETRPWAVGLLDAATRWRVAGGFLQYGTEGGRHVPVSATLVVVTESGEEVPLIPRAVRLNGQTITQPDATFGGSLVVHETERDDGPAFWDAYYLPERAETFVPVRLLIMGEDVPGFERVYPTDADAFLPDIGIWRLSYAAAGQVDRRYLRKRFPPGDLRRGVEASRRTG